MSMRMLNLNDEGLQFSPIGPWVPWCKQSKHLIKSKAPRFNGGFPLPIIYRYEQGDRGKSGRDYKYFELFSQV